MIVLNENGRITYGKVSRSAYDWIEVMGYDIEDVRNASRTFKVPFKDVVQKLVDYVYGGEQCTYTFKDKRKPKHSLIGMWFSKLLVIGVNEDSTQWVCRCTCGNTCLCTTKELVSKDKRSCGCGMMENRHYYLNMVSKGTRPPCRILSFKGRTLTVTQWAKEPDIIELGIKRRLIYLRLNRGWSIEETLTTPCGVPRKPQ